MSAPATSRFLEYVVMVHRLPNEPELKCEPRVYQDFMDARHGSTRSFRCKHEALYASERDCARYDAELCRRQDHANGIVEAVREVVPLTRGTVVADIGAGTGKLARLLAPHVASVAIIDRSGEALAVAREAMREVAGSDGCSLSFHEADLRALPLETCSTHLVIAGWAVSYLKSEHEEWYADGSSGGPWREEVDAALAEMDRVLTPGGTLVLLETLGTATATPQRSGSWLYAHLRDAGLAQRVVRTDYRFPDKSTALRTLLFFFGKGVARRAEALLATLPSEGEPCIVPECTGMWWRHKPCLHPPDRTDALAAYDETSCRGMCGAPCAVAAGGVTAWVCEAVSSHRLVLVASVLLAGVVVLAAAQTRAVGTLRQSRSLPLMQARFR